MTLSEAYNYGVYFLSANGVDEADFKSLCLCCHCAGIKNNEYEIHKNEDLIIMKKFADMLWQIKSGEPLQYVIGRWDFYESEFHVGRGVLIPRPETEELTELVLDNAKRLCSPVVFDLCSGSGCIGISIAKALPSSTVYCVEKSEEALQYLLKNAESISNVKVVNSDINYPSDIKNADIIVSNPPYIKSSDLSALQREVQYEPPMALDGGADGLDFYRIIAEKWNSNLKENGMLFLEIGEDQGEAVYEILEKQGFKEIEVIKDMYGNNRMVKSVKK
ncbi:MAG: peptide chain release factor N(5)-glutamine methyltransferase [Eubacterium sp.]|nr:peptide chain release factor N(5)-glutamine methyltransferase [Eubacterium sp.]